MPKSPEQFSVNENKEKKKDPKFGDYVRVNLVSAEGRRRRNDLFGDVREGMFVRNASDGTVEVMLLGDDPATVFRGFEPEVIPDDDIKDKYTLEALQKARFHFRP